MDEIEVNIPPFFNELKKNPAFKHAVIAGGFLRDQYIRLNPDDIDIFVPSTGLNSFLDTMLLDTGDLKQGGPIFNKVEYSGEGRKYFGEANPKAAFVKFDCTTNDGYKVDIMAMRMNVADFGNLLIEGFPYGNQQVFHDGKKIFYTEHFQNDIENHFMSLRHCSSVEDLVHVFPKYEKMKERYRKELGLRLRFASDYILTKRSGDDWL
jgi:hypothetical protein